MSVHCVWIYSGHKIDEVLNRLAEGENVGDIAESSGVQRRTIARWQAGQRPEHAAALQRLASPSEVSRRAPARYAYLLGLYLGDGHLVEFRRSCWALRISLDARHPSIAQEAKGAMLACRGCGSASVRKLSDSSCVIVTSYSKAWPALFPQHGAGRKHDRSIVLEPWQAAVTRAYAEDLVRGLIHSDGSRYRARQQVGGATHEYDRYSFSNVSEDILGIFSTHLDHLGVAWTRANRKTIQIARRGAVNRLDAFVGPKR